ncbi:hypothetical protein [Micromonospora sp. RTGN7]|nr:hypothetical protein [Micromonospora sp. RTGN7]
MSVHAAVAACQLGSSRSSRVLQSDRWSRSWIGPVDAPEVSAPSVKVSST